MDLMSIPLDMQAQMFGRLLIATLIGALVGYEHERSGKPAGVRMHGLVGLGAALFAAISIDGFPGNPNTATVAAGVVTGIGFLGAGAILRRNGDIHGLTTAACLWVTAAIGLAAGVGMVVMSVTSALLALALLHFGPHGGSAAAGPQPPKPEPK
jgi:putative Mg2+ transporter-C (MgtC) family protein